MVQPKWINVKDSLPELSEKTDESEDVLVYDSGCYHIAYLCLYPKSGYRLKDVYKWIERSSGCGCCSEGINPTHWMDLPKPPNNINL